MLSAGLVLIVLFTLLDPQASNGLSIGPRVVFWSLHVALPLAMAQGFQVAFSRKTKLSAWPAIFLSGVFAALAFTPVATLLDFWFAVPDEDGELGVFNQASLLDEFLGLASPVVLSWVALNAIRGIRLTPPANSVLHEGPKLVRLLSANLRQNDPIEIVALSAELHYTRVYTPQGDDLVLYAFSKAVGEAGEGVQIHRSHWVASGYVDALQKNKTGWIVALKNGLQFPVARARRKEVAQALNL